MDRHLIETELNNTALVIAELATQFCYANEDFVKTKMYRALVRYSILKKKLSACDVERNFGEEVLKEACIEPEYEEVITDQDDEFKDSLKEIKRLASEMQTKYNVKLNICSDGEDLLIEK